MGYPFSPGEKLKAAELNTAIRQAYKNFQAAEDLIVNDAVVLNPDGKIQKARADFNDWRSQNFIGFNVLATASGAVTVSGVQVSGIVGGFSGLEVGKEYYLSDTPGAISSTPGTYEKPIGIAISDTELIIRTAPESIILHTIDSKFQYEVILGSDVKKGSPLFNGDGIEKVSLNLFTGSTSSKRFGDLLSSLYIRQKFLSDDIEPFNTIKVSLRRANYPTDNIILRVYDETLTTLLAEKTIPGMSLSTSLTAITFDLPLIIPKQTIWIYLTRSGPIDSSNWYEIGYYPGLYAPTDLEYGDGTTWATEVGYDMIISFSFLPTINRAFPSGAIYPELFENYLGLANTDGLKEQTIKVSRFTHFLNTDWNLEPNRIYYLSDTPGEITLTPPENKKVIGYSIASNKLMIF